MKVCLFPHIGSRTAAEIQVKFNAFCGEESPLNTLKEPLKCALVKSSIMTKTLKNKKRRKNPLEGKK